MESTGLFVIFFGAAVLFFADWQNMSAEWVASILFAVAAMGGFFVNRWRVRLSIFLTATLLAAEWASEHLRFWESHVHAAFPNILILDGLSFIFALTASLMGAGVRSFFDAGRK